MPLRIRVSGSARADELLAYLRGLGADAHREDDAINVRRSHAPLRGEPASQERIELEFLLRTWAGAHPGTEFVIEEAG